MTDEPASPPPERRARSPRRVRFVLPIDHHDERADARIEAFLEGPSRVARRPAGAASGRGSPDRPRRAIQLDTRTDWDHAVRQEDARLARYGRPASVMVVIIGPADAAQADRYAQRVGQAIRTHARETDRVARVGPARFHVLMPETLETDATSLADRVRAACADSLPGQSSVNLEVRTVVATPVHGQTLSDALHLALRRADL